MQDDTTFTRNGANVVSESLEREKHAALCFKVSVYRSTGAAVRGPARVEHFSGREMGKFWPVM